MIHELSTALRVALPLPGFWSARRYVVVVLAVLVLGCNRDNAVLYLGHTVYLSDNRDGRDALSRWQAWKVRRWLKEARVPASFNTKKEMVDGVFALMAPGYGMITHETRAGDGSVLHLFGIEVPRADQDRVIVCRERNGKFDLIDDFVYDTDKRVIDEIAISGGKIIYRTREGSTLFRHDLRRP